jgi:hypothetical protein
VPYCSSAGKFAGYDDAEAEVDSEALDDMNLAIDVRVYRPCAECSQEVAEYTFNLEQMVEHECDPPEPSAEPRHDDPEEDPELTLESVDVEATDSYQTTDPRTGRKITNPRYQKHMIGVQATANIQCERCGKEWSETLEDSVPASSFDGESSH